MIGIPEAFSPTYAVARRKFLEAAAAGAVVLVVWLFPGREGASLVVVGDAAALQHPLIEAGWPVVLHH